MIEARGVYFFLEDGPYMPSLEHLIDHYSRFADGLPFKLCHPLFKVLKAKDPTYALGKFNFIGKLLFDKISLRVIRQLRGSNLRRCHFRPS